MESQGARQKILQKIKQALKDPVPVPFPDQVADTPLFIPTEQELAINFAQKFKANDALPISPRSSMPKYSTIFSRQYAKNQHTK